MGALDPLRYDQATQTISVKPHPSFSGTVTSELGFAAPAFTAINAAHTVAISDSIRIEGTLGPSPSSRLFIADSANDIDREGNFIEVYSNDPLLPRPVFQLTRLGGMRLWDWLSLAPGTGGPLFWSPAYGAMLSAGSDLGPDGVTVSLTNSAFGHDFLQINSYSPSGFDNGTRRFTVADSGLVAFGKKLATIPALKPNGSTLEVRRADDSGLAELRVRWLSGGEFTLWDAWINDSLAVGTDLGGLKLAAKATKISRVSLRVSTPGAAQGSAAVTITDGTSTCTATFACATMAATGTYDAVAVDGDGTGCAFAASAALSASVTGSGCSPAAPRVKNVTFLGAHP